MQDLCKQICTIDTIHQAIDVFSQDITQYVWKNKYNWQEDTPEATFLRVCKGIYTHDEDAYRNAAYVAMKLGLWVPGGRILAGAGTEKAVTLINCYVDRTIDDSMGGIADALKDAMLTMQQGGGIGMDFSTLRPEGAHLNRTGAIASGPLPFMEMWDSMCSTIMSAGARRGAMMGVLHCEHPDLLKFIEMKSKPGVLTNFNVSVLVADAFIDAVQNDEEWHLGFGVPRSDGKHLFTVDREDVEGGIWYVYSEHKARDLWDTIIRHTYDYSEPGVVFIDRINDQNNLQYCEIIAATNPCGEQPLPPNGACNLGAVNLARLVLKPFQKDVAFDWTTFKTVIHIGVRFLDNVIDVTNYPLNTQAAEETSKRRLGLGITGLADAMIEMGIRYGSEESLHFTGKVMEMLKVEAYRASTNLAEERGFFPLFDPLAWGHTPVVNSLPSDIKADISDHGIRNGVLLTIAPTGTTSLLMGNVSSGLEPVFEFEGKRNVIQQDGSTKSYDVTDYAHNLWVSMRGTLTEIEGDRWITVKDLKVRDHIRMQAVCQEHVDASISKTINCPEDMTFEEFKLMYWDAYELGCKGCTTYRPSDVRGSVLVSNVEEKPIELKLKSRPSSLSGKTYKLKWGNAAYYLTINDLDGKPFEVFLASTSGKYTDWQTALSLMISAVMRQGQPIDFIHEELKKVVSMTDYAYVKGVFYGSLVSLIGHTIEAHIAGNGDHLDEDTIETPKEIPPEGILGDFCPKCNNPTLISREGCMTCISCSYSNCG